MHKGGKKKNQKVNGRFGFTLIEIVVVMAIIAVLAALIVAAIAAARRSAMRARIKEDAKTLQTGLELYRAKKAEFPKNMWHAAYQCRGTTEDCSTLPASSGLNHSLVTFEKIMPAQFFRDAEKYGQGAYCGLADGQGYILWVGPPGSMSTITNWGATDYNCVTNAQPVGTYDFSSR